MTEIEKKVAINKAMGKLYPQLVINCRKLCGKGWDAWGSDLLPHTISQFLNMPLDRQYEIMFDDKHKPEFYLTRAMALQLKSSTSTFYIRYRKPMIANRELLPDYDYKDYNTTLDTPLDTEIKECLEYHTYNTLDYYDKYLITEHYYKGVNVSDMSKNLDIQPGRLGRDIKKALTKLKKLCSQV
jgi:hypothetical protein